MPSMPTFNVSNTKPTFTEISYTKLRTFPKAELLPVPYFHVVYTLPSQLRDIAYQNKRVLYNLLMKAAAETTLTIAADPKRLGARIGVTAVLHTWGPSARAHDRAGRWTLA